MQEQAEMYPGQFVRGTVFEIVGTRISSGKSGNHYEVAARNVIFDEWNKHNLVLGEKVYCRGFDGRPFGYYIDYPEERVEGYFFVILKHHGRWGIFLPCHPGTSKYTDLATIEKVLAWHRQDGEQPKIENDDPGTFHYQTVVVDGREMDVLERIKG